MPSTIILSDNGATSGSAGLKTSGGNDGVLLLQTTTSGGTATTALTIDNTQNIGFGVAPSAWGSGYTALEMPGGGHLMAASGLMQFGANTYWNGSAYIYKVNGPAGRYNITNNAGSISHAWSTAPTGTAGGTVTFTQAMTLDASGNLLLGSTSISGTSSDNKIVGIYGAGSSNRAQLRLTNSNTGTTGSDGFALSVDSSTNVFLTQYENASIVFETNGANERARIDASGRLLIGTTSASTGTNLKVGGGGVGTDSFFGFSNIQQTASPFSVFISASASESLGLFTASTERVRVDSSGRFLIGATSSQAIGGVVQTTLQVNGTGYDASTTGITAISWYNGVGYGANLYLGHVRSGTVGSQTATVSGTELGNVIFGGSTGSVSSAGANIVGWSSDSTWTGSSTPAYMSFYTTPAGSTTGLERMRLNSSGQVLLPYQPAFMATEQAITFTPASGVYVYGAVKLNRGSHYNSSTGRFTAPVSGVYYFVHQISARPTSSSVIEAKIYINGGEYSRTFISGAGNVPNGVAALTISLSANDYVEAAFYNGNSPQVVLSGSNDITSGSNGIVSGWMGWLLG